MTRIIKNKKEIFNTLLIEAKTNIERLESKGANVYALNEEISALENRCGEIDYNYISENDISNFEYATKRDYKEDIKKLKSIINKLNRYNLYLQVYSTMENLENDCKNEDITKEKYLDNINDLYKLLENLKKCSSNDVALENEFILKLYSLTLNLIQKGIRDFGDYKLFEKLCKDKYHKANLNSAINEYLSTLDLNGIENKIILEKKNEIDQIGLNASYCTKEFITLLSISGPNEELFNNKIDKVLNKISSLSDNYSILKNRIEDKKCELKKLSNFIDTKDVVEDFITIVMSLSLIVSAFNLSLNGTKKILSKNNTVQTMITLNYSELTDETKSKVKKELNEEDFENDKSVYLMEYGLWERDSNKFFREILIYDLSFLDEMNLKDYLNVDLESLGIKPKIKYQEEELSTTREIYDTVYREVQKSNIITETKPENIVLQVLLSIFITVFSYSFIALALNIATEEKINLFEILASFNNLFSELEKIGDNNSDKYENNEIIKSLLKNAKELYLNYSHEIKDIQKMIETLKLSDKEKARTINEELQKIKKLDK